MEVLHLNDADVKVEKIRECCNSNTLYNLNNKINLNTNSLAPLEDIYDNVYY